MPQVFEQSLFLFKERVIASKQNGRCVQCVSDRHCGDSSRLSGYLSQPLIFCAYHFRFIFTLICRFMCSPGGMCVPREIMMELEPGMCNTPADCDGIHQSVYFVFAVTIYTIYDLVAENPISVRDSPLYPLNYPGNIKNSREPVLLPEAL